MTGSTPRGEERNALQDLGDEARRNERAPSSERIEVALSATVRPPPPQPIAPSPQDDEDDVALARALPSPRRLAIVVALLVAACAGFVGVAFRRMSNDRAAAIEAARREVEVPRFRPVDLDIPPPPPSAAPAPPRPSAESATATKRPKSPKRSPESGPRPGRRARPDARAEGMIRALGAGSPPATNSQ